MYSILIQNSKQTRATEKSSIWKWYFLAERRSMKLYEQNKNDNTSVTQFFFCSFDQVIQEQLELTVKSRISSNKKINRKKKWKQKQH